MQLAAALSQDSHLIEHPREQSQHETTQVEHTAVKVPDCAAEQVASLRPSSDAAYCEVHLFRHDLGILKPQTVKVLKGSTVGELHVAEDSLQTFSLHSRMCDGVGAFVSDTCKIENDLELHVHLLRDDSCFQKCPFQTGILGSFADFAPMTRLDFLDFQHGWVAKDEMDFYLNAFL